MPSGYYYFGGYDMTQKEITVLMVEPGKHPKVTTLKDDLDSLQKAVSIGADYQGLIEFVSLGNGDCIMCNEEGKLIGLDGNRRLGDDSKAYNCSFLMSGRPNAKQDMFLPVDRSKNRLSYTASSPASRTKETVERLSLFLSVHRRQKP